MRRYLLIEEFTCQECHGSGWVQHPLWARYWEANPGGGLTVEEDQTWFREQGEYTPPHLIPEEEPCVECEGAGKIRREVDLVTALVAIGLLYAVPITPLVGEERPASVYVTAQQISAAIAAAVTSIKSYRELSAAYVAQTVWGRVQQPHLPLHSESGQDAWNAFQDALLERTP